MQTYFNIFQKYCIHCASLCWGCGDLLCHLCGVHVQVFIGHMYYAIEVKGTVYSHNRTVQRV